MAKNASKTMEKEKAKEGDPQHPPKGEQQNSRNLDFL